MLFLIAWGWRKHPLFVALVLGLLANVEMHAAAISGGLAIVYCIEQFRSGVAKDPERRNRLLQFGLVLICLYAISILTTAWPARDLGRQGL